MRFKFLVFCAALVALLLFWWLPHTGAEPVSAGFWTQTAIGGKDTVSYHDSQARQEHRVLDGTGTYAVQYLGAQWRFASMSDAERFAAHPAAYVPSYNGHGANALASGEGLVKTDGSVWGFFGGRLYLFRSEAGRQRWLQGDWNAYRALADAAWQAR